MVNIFKQQQVKKLKVGVNIPAYILQAQGNQYLLPSSKSHLLFYFLYLSANNDMEFHVFQENV